MTATMPHDEADYQRISLLLGLNSADDVVRWADDQIAQSDVPSCELIDISLGRLKPVHEIESLLRTLVADHNDNTALKDVLSKVAADVRSNSMSIESAISKIYNYLQFDDRDEDLYFSFVAMEDDMVCIRDGLYGNSDISLLRKPFFELLESYCKTTP